MVLDILSIVLCAVLLGLASLHLVWAMGSTFPCRDEETLARTVVGRRGIRHMPSAPACLFVAAGLASAAMLALAIRWSGAFPLFKWGLAPLGLLMALIFLGRGIIGVMPAFERATPEQPFLQLNRRLYSPLCVLLGLSFLLLTVAMPNWSWRLGLS